MRAVCLALVCLLAAPLTLGADEKKKSHKANLKAAKGEVDEALRLQVERLKANRELDDQNGIVAALWDIAKIELQTGSHVEGDIVTARLVIDEGVFFEGACKMGSSPSKTTAPSATDKPATSWGKKDEKETARV